VKPGRRDTARRITPELMAFYKMRAKQLRDEAFRDMWRGLWALVMKIMQPSPSSFRGARSASPKSITTIGSMDSGPAPRGASSDAQLRIGE